MANITFEPFSVEGLKREAKVMKKAEGVTHAQALDAMAARHNYLNWAMLMKHHNYKEREGKLK